MITAILTVLVVQGLFYGRLPMSALAPLSAGLGAAVLVLGWHKHSRFLTIDILAQVSRLNKVDGLLKFWTTLTLMVLCVLAKSPVVGIVLAAFTLIFIVCIGGLKLREYVRLLSLPVSFLMLSGLALLIEITNQPAGVISVPVFGVWLSISETAQTRAALIIGRAFGAVSCLYVLSLTTPMSELIGVLRRIKCPDVLIALMYLIYRYIFILLSMFHSMKDASKSRLGDIDYRTSVRTTGKLYANLLSRSYRQANRNFDAMESRCFDTEIRFLESRKRVTAVQGVIAAGVTLLTLAMTLLIS